MRFSFVDHCLDADRRELRRAGTLVPVEPQVFDVLVHLIRHRDQVVSKDALIDAVWGGRIISESTLTSRINAARAAVGDDGRAQAVIRTVTRKGFRFVADVREDAPPAAAAAPPDIDARDPPAPRRASIAVMPFVDASPVVATPGGAGEALASDIITRLAKLRTLFVIAQGTVRTLAEHRVGPEEAGRLLKVDYVLGGSVRRADGRLAVAVELIEAEAARIVWTDRFERAAADILLVLDEVGDRIVAAIAGEIEAAERNRAVLKPPETLDAWEAYHRGLWHMYRFSKADNDRARHFFELAVRRDPTFSRAHAGLSFAHWQNAFQGWADRARETELAYAAAGESLMADDRDPAAHWAMGRALWLGDRLDQSLGALDQAVDLSPNFAQGHYTLAFVHSTTGDPTLALPAAEHSQRLSPFDPMLFAMYASRALALVRLGRYEEAAALAVNAAARPNAHVHIEALASYALVLADRVEEGRAFLTRVRATSPGYAVDQLVAAFRLESVAEGVIRTAQSRANLG